MRDFRGVIQMHARNFFRWTLRLLFIGLVASLAAVSTWAQFNASIQGSVSDPSGAAVSGTKITLENLSTHVLATTTSGADGSYRFVSLAPGNYKISAEASGFSKSETTVTLDTSQNLSVALTLKVGATTESIEVTAENPLFNTAETRNQMTLETQELGTLPMAGRNMLSLTTLAPGVSGLGLAGGPGVASGTPGIERQQLFYGNRRRRQRQRSRYRREHVDH